MTAVKRRPPPLVLVLPSSKVITSRVWAQSAEPVTFGTKPRRKASAVASEQSWASLHRLGTTKATSTEGSKLASGWMLAHWAVVETELKLIAGTCLRAYVPATPGPSTAPE